MADVDGRWYLLGLPALKVVNDMSAMVDKQRGYRDQVCGCANKACADAARADELKWMTDVSATMDPSAKPSPEEVKAAVEFEQQTNDCLKMLAAKAAPPPPPPPPAMPTMPTMPTASDATMPVECNAYFDAVAKLGSCAALPQQTKDAFQAGVAAMKTSIASAGAAGAAIMGETCKKMTDAMMIGVHAYCP